MAAANKTEKIEHVLLSEIEVSHAFNCRFAAGEKEASGGKEDENSFDGLVASIRATGGLNETPVILRKQKQGSKKPYFLVAGFRRFAAVQKISADDGKKNPTIRAEIHDMTDQEARERNIRENTARDDLSPSDKVFGVGALLNNNKDLDSTKIGEMIGLSQPYAAKLMRINNCKLSILKDWRSSPNKLKIDQMDAISKLKSPEEQEAKYKEYCDALAGRTAEKEAGEKEGGKNRWKDTAREKAADVGMMLGKLSRDGAVEIVGDDFFRTHIRTLVKFTDKATEEDIRSISNAAEKGFADGQQAEEAESEKDAAKKGSGKKKSTAAKEAGAN